MRSRLLLGALVAAIVATIAAVAVPAHHVAPRHGLRAGENEAAELLEPGDVAYARAFGLKAPAVDPGAAFAAATEQASTLPTLGGNWELTGPTSIGGRVLDV